VHTATKVNPRKNVVGEEFWTEHPPKIVVGVIVEAVTEREVAEDLDNVDTCTSGRQLRAAFRGIVGGTADAAGAVVAGGRGPAATARAVLTSGRHRPVRHAPSCCRSCLRRRYGGDGRPCDGRDPAAAANVAPLPACHR
jgi:hypothetical protein